MDLEKNLSGKYSSMGIVSGNELYLPLSIAEHFIRDCSSLSLAITGVDFFRISNSSIIPVVQINSIDTCSLFNINIPWCENVRNCNSFVLKTLGQKECKDIVEYCNFVLISESEYLSIT